MNRIYIAAPFFSKEQLDFVKGIEDKLDEYGLQYFSPRSFGKISHLSQEKKRKASADIFQSNISEIYNAKTVIAVIDGHDTGTMWEMGYAFALNRDVISITNNDYGINIMLAESVRAHIKSIDDIPKALLNKNYTGELVKDFV